MTTHTHTRGGGTWENTSKLRMATQNMGGFGLEVRSHKNRTKAGPKMQYLRKSAERNATDVLIKELKLLLSVKTFVLDN
jgi:hypothetical protein